MAIRIFSSGEFDPSEEANGEPVYHEFLRQLTDADPGPWLPVPAECMEVPGADVRLIPPWVRCVYQFSLHRGRMMGRYDVWIDCQENCWRGNAPAASQHIREGVGSK